MEQQRLANKKLDALIRMLSPRRARDGRGGQRLRHLLAVAALEQRFRRGAASGRLDVALSATRRAPVRTLPEGTVNRTVRVRAGRG